MSYMALYPHDEEQPCVHAIFHEGQIYCLVLVWAQFPLFLHHHISSIVRVAIVRSESDSFPFTLWRRRGVSCLFQRSSIVFDIFNRLVIGGSRYKEKPKSDYASARVPILKIHFIEFSFFVAALMACLGAFCFSLFIWQYSILEG